MTLAGHARMLVRLAAALPRGRAWIGRVVRDARPARRPVASLGFTGLPRHFPGAFLRAAGVVVVDEPPQPPLADWGLAELDLGQPMHVSGITFLDTYFVRRGREGDESLHFHELVHVAQWRRLGFAPFLLAYGAGFAREGYRQSPLERSAYDLTDRFVRGEAFDALDAAVADADAIAAGFRASGVAARGLWSLAGVVPPPPTR